MAQSAAMEYETTDSGTQMQWPSEHYRDRVDFVSVSEPKDGTVQLFVGTSEYDSQGDVDLTATRVDWLIERLKDVRSKMP